MPIGNLAGLSINKKRKRPSASANGRVAAGRPTQANHGGIAHRDRWIRALVFAAPVITATGMAPGDL
jgi:hypothetical protein